MIVPGRRIPHRARAAARSQTWFHRLVDGSPTIERHDGGAAPS
jgi:hypothetical protein